MRLSDFDFELPPERIALRPAEPRDHARLLTLRPGETPTHHRFRDLPRLLRPGDALVFNDTRVISARLAGRRERHGSIAEVEATLHRRLAADRWSAFMRPGKRLREGDRIIFQSHVEAAAPTEGLAATLVTKREEGEVELVFDLAGPALDQAVEVYGLMPLPPYIASRRAEDDRDRRDYQTVYARVSGSVAAPTAGLHFTADLLARLAEAGVSSHFVTLHVGAGTFLPVKAEAVADHRMHAEYGAVGAEVAQRLEAVRAAGGRIVCVGTTSLRLLESAAQPDGRIEAFAGETAIFIKPGYRFRAADGMITNFHLPRSTLFMLVAALCGLEAIRDTYRTAIAEGYRFYSYGDASLLWRAD